MTAQPEPAGVDRVPSEALCRCKHTAAHHEVGGLAPQCTGPGCSCLRYRPPAEPQRVRLVDGARFPDREGIVPLPEPSDDELFRNKGLTIEGTLKAGKKSTSKRTVALTEKIAVMIHDLRGRLTDEKRAAEEAAAIAAIEAAAREQIADLERRLAEARASLRMPKKAPAEAKIPCPKRGCKKKYTTQGWLDWHLRTQH